MSWQPWRRVRGIQGGGWCALILMLTITTNAQADDPVEAAPAETPPATKAAAEPAAPAADEHPDVKQIRERVASLTDAFNKHDATAVAAHWTEQGEFITPGGQELVGREAIEKAYGGYFDKNKDVKLDVGTPAIERHSPSVASERGFATVMSPEGEPITTEYLAVHVKTPDGWRIDSISETSYEEPRSNYERLKVLEPLIGSWANSEGDTTITADYRWTKNANFMTNHFKVFAEDVVSLEGTQVIGWDASNNCIRSWIFDSEGGFGVGRWSRDGDGWKVRSLQVLADGSRTSSVQLYEVIDENTIRFRSVGREIDGELLPNVGPVKIERQ